MEEEEEEEKFSLGPLWLPQGVGGLAPHALCISRSFSSEAAFKREGMEGRKAAHPVLTLHSGFLGCWSLAQPSPRVKTGGGVYNPGQVASFFAKIQMIILQPVKQMSTSLLVWEEAGVP